MSTAPGRRLEVSWTWTWACARARSSAGAAGSNGGRPSLRTHLPATPSLHHFFLPLHPHPPHAHSLTSRGMMMGLPVKGHSLRRVHQLPVAKAQGHLCVCACVRVCVCSCERVSVRARSYVFAKFCSYVCVCVCVCARAYACACVRPAYCHASKKGLPPRWRHCRGCGPDTGVSPAGSY